jgi:hypothetical protein
VTLLHFSWAEQFDLLRHFSGDHPPHWVEAVEAEVRRGMQRDKTRVASERILNCGWLDSSVEPPDSSRREVENLRIALNDGVPPDKSGQHLGEAQSIFLAKACGGTVLTDDGRAVEMARFHGVRVLHAIDVLQALVVDGVLTGDRAFDCANAMVGRGRFLYIRSYSRSTFDC